MEGCICINVAFNWSNNQILSIYFSDRSLAQMMNNAAVCIPRFCDNWYIKLMYARKVCGMYTPANVSSHEMKKALTLFKPHRQGLHFPNSKAHCMCKLFSNSSQKEPNHYSMGTPFSPFLPLSFDQKLWPYNHRIHIENYYCYCYIWSKSLSS